MSTGASESGIFRVSEPRKVLCLDDDIVIARMVGDVVRFCGHEPVVEFDSVAAIVGHVRGNFGAVISDLYMPKVSGIDVLAAFMQSSPKTRRILLTAAPNDSEVQEAIREGIIQMLIPKPPFIHDIRSALAWM